VQQQTAQRIGVTGEEGLQAGRIAVTGAGGLLDFDRQYLAGRIRG